MTTTSNPYPSNILSAGTYAEEHGTNPITAMLVSGYTFDDEDVFLDDVSGEITTGDVERVPLDGIAVVVDGPYVTITADPFTFPECTFTDADGIIFFADTGTDSTSPLIGHLGIAPTDNTAEPFLVTPVGGVLISTEPASGVLTVAGIEPDETGDVPVDDIADAIAAELATFGDPSEGEPGQVWTINNDGDDVGWADTRSTMAMPLGLYHLIDYRRLVDGPIPTTTNGDGLVDPATLTDPHLTVDGAPYYQAAQVVDGALQLRDVSPYQAGAVLTASLRDGQPWVTGFAFAGWADSSDESDLNDGGNGQAIINRSLLSAGGDGYSVELVAEWDGVSAAEHRVDLNRKDDFSIAATLDSFTLPAQPADGDTFELFLDPDGVGGWHLAVLVNGEPVATADDSTVTYDEFYLCTNSISTDSNVVDGRWRGGVRAAWCRAAWVNTSTGGGGSGDVATDAIWNAAGDLAVGTGSDTATRLALGSSGLPLVSNGSTVTYAALSSTGLAADSVGSSQIAASAVTASELASDAVTTAKILDANVTTAKIADDAITTAKLADVHGSSVLVASSRLSSNCESGLIPYAAAGSATTLAVGAGWLFNFGGVCEQSISALALSVLASSLSGGQVVIVAVYNTAADGGPGTVAWQEQVAVGTGTGVIWKTGLSRTRPTSGWISVVNPTGNAGTVTLNRNAPAPAITTAPCNGGGVVGAFTLSSQSDPVGSLASQNSLTLSISSLPIILARP